MILLDFFKEIFVSIAIGTLIGIEREHHFAGRKEFAGLRTFALVSLFGTVCAMLAETYGAWIVLVGLAAVSFYGGIAYLSSFNLRKAIGITTEVAFVISFTLGVMIHTVGAELSIALSIIITLILAMKRYTEQIGKNIKDVELMDTLKFAILAFIILPILPNTYIDPFNIINPYQLWILVILISGISYFGYFLMKLFGTGRGILITSALGGIASSTAVTVDLSDKVKKDERIIGAATVGVLVASTIMFFRVLLLVSVININLLPFLLPPVLVMGVLGLIFSWFIAKGMSRFKHELKLTSPLSIYPALKFVVFFIFILLVSYFGNRYFGDAGIYVASILSGLVDVDAIILSLSTLAKTGISYKVASIAIIVASVTNTFVKAGISFLFGSRKFGMQVFKVLIPVAVVGLLVALIL